nr:hypothetical protein [uncultured Shinella sp.]
MKKIQKILVASRGEITVRVVRVAIPVKHLRSGWRKAGAISHDCNGRVFFELLGQPQTIRVPNPAVRAKI